VTPRVKFTIELNFASQVQRKRLLSMYGSRFSALIGEAKRKKYFSVDHEYLPGIRQLLSGVRNVEELIPVLRPELSEDAILRLTEVAPLFNVAPVALQSFILLGLGFRNVERKNVT